MKLGIAQMPVSASVSDNLKCAREYVMRLKCADMVMLPEMFCAPYSNQSFAANAEPRGGVIYTALADIARDAGVYLVGGSMPELEDGRIYNTSFVFSPDGTEIARHRKVHLFDIDITGGQRFFESDTLSSGDAATVFDTPFGKFGLCICFDMRFSELAMTMARRGVQMILTPAAFNMTTGPLHWELMFRARAVDNQVFTAGAAPARDASSSYVSYGHSIVVSPWGKILNCAGSSPCEFITDIDFNEVSRVRRELPILSARKSEVYI